MIKLVELFGGIGAPRNALRNIGIDVDVVDYVEIDKYAVQSYNNIYDEKYTTQDVTKWDKDLDIDLLFHGSPCQDFSLAGKQAGGKEGSGTRSSLMWETVRIIEKNKPKIVMWENVKAVINKRHIDVFNKYLQKLESLGYENKYQVLNTKNYEVPQNRERVFVVSILGKNNFKFPKKIKLKYSLKDFLDKEVDEKYYLSNKMIKYITADNEKWTGNNDKSLINKKVASAINTGEGSRRCDASNYITDDLDNEDVDIKPYFNINEKTKKGYKEAHEGDGVYINRPHQKRGCVQDGMVPTIKTSGSDIGVVVAGQFQPKDRDYKNKGKEREEHFETRKDKVSNAVLTGSKKNCILTKKNTLRIRKLTPRECWRLQGFSDRDFNKAAEVCSNTQLYKQAGNSITVTVLEHIFRELFKDEVTQSSNQKEPTQKIITAVYGYDNRIKSRKTKTHFLKIEEEME